MSRFRAFAIHLAISFIIFLIFLAVMRFAWYPWPYFEINGGWSVLQLLIGVDVVLGPLLTLIVFKSGKRGLKFDLSCIALLQLGAIIYGAHIVYQERPLFTLYAVDRFTVIVAGEVDPSELKYAELKRLAGIGPMLAYLGKPKDIEEANRVLFELMEGGKDRERRPEYYEPYDPYRQPARAELEQRNLDLAKIRGSGAQAAQAVDDFMQQQGGQPDDYFFFPLVGKEKDIVIVLSREHALPVGYIDTDPWVAKS
jgi:hypothetical protein